MKTHKIYYTYFLVNSLTQQIRYVGKGKGKRMYCHVKNALRGKRMNNNKKYNGIRNIFRNHGKIIYFKYRENLTERQALGIEKICIKKLGRNNLWNLTDGGDGGGILKGHKFSIEHNRKISIANKGKASWLKGKHHSKESIEKMCLSHKGAIFTKEHRRKLSLAGRKRIGKLNPFYGKKHAKETIKKLSLTHKGHVDSLITRNKKSKATKKWFKSHLHPMFGKHLSLNTKKKIGFSLRGNVNAVRRER